MYKDSILSLISGVYLAAVTNKGTCHMYQLKRMAVPAINQLAQQQSNEAASPTSAGPPSQPQQPQQLALYPEPKKPFTAHKRYALKCAFSPDSTMLATTSADQTTRLWRTTDLGLITVSVLSRALLFPLSSSLPISPFCKFMWMWVILSTL